MDGVPLPEQTLNDRVALRTAPVDQSPVIFQNWDHLLFLHWEVPASDVQNTLPPGLRVDTYDGKAYLGVVSFLMKNVRPRLLPVVPGISTFPELNLRTYVYDDRGIPGVWFYSLEAGKHLPVWLARRHFHLPYHYARMSFEGAIRQH